MKKGNELSPQKNNFKENISAVILCAGKGTRLRKITKITPKPLIKIERLNNISILQHSIDSLIKLDIKQIGIVIGYLGEKISNFISNLIKRNKDLKDNLILIDAENQYKLGALYSFLSITKNSSFFTKNNHYLVIPGDTIFDYNIIEEVLNSTFKNNVLIQNHPLIFYRKIDTRKLRDIYKAERLISKAEIVEIGPNLALKKITQIKIEDINYKDEINQLIPILILDYNTINEISNFTQKKEIKTIWEYLNYLILKKKRIICIRIEKKYKFFDIDTESDIWALKKKREKDNRCSD
jgi:NDP-sugar pyrophosphorylase family protein